MTTIREGIYSLMSAVQVDTKEHGRTHIKPWLSQRLVIDGICKGLAEGCHEFVILKSRQMAITTVADLIALFWSLANAGTQGAIIADRGDNLERLRRIFAAFLETLPPEWRGPDHRLLQNNRQGMVFANRSTIDLLAAANNPDLGASRAINLGHFTECSLWRSLAGVESLRASLARQNPNRLYIWESIANGYNWFEKHWQQAKHDRHMRAIFCGFWANPTYSIAKDDEDYPTYWDGSLTDDEVNNARYVREHYGYTVKPEQVAWWRRESEYRAEEYMARHYPWTERQCFIASGSGFFPASRVVEIAEAMGDGVPYQGYRYAFDERFLSSHIEQTLDRDQVTLKVWEHPVNDAVQSRNDFGQFDNVIPAGVYVIGIDPSGGGGDEADDHAIEVFRCYADKIVQVAEFQSNRPHTYQLAWVLAHLCGAYRNHTANLEVTGIGAAVLPEVRNLRQLAERGILQADSKDGPILDMIGCVRWFLFKRPDTFSGGGNVINWKSNYDNKNQIYAELRDSLMLRRLEIRSTNLIRQMQAIVFDQGRIGAGDDTGENDDLVSATVLAHHVWVERIMPGLIARRMTWDSVHRAPPAGHNPQALSETMSFAISRHFQAIHDKARVRRERF